MKFLFTEKDDNVKINKIATRVFYYTESKENVQVVYMLNNTDKKIFNKEALQYLPEGSTVISTHLVVIDLNLSSQEFNSLVNQ